MNLAMLLDMAAEGMGERTAIAGAGSEVTFSRLREASADRARELPASSVVALADTNGPVVPLTLFSACWAGCSYAPVNYRLPADAIAQLLSDLGPETIVCSESLSNSVKGVTGATVHSSTRWSGPERSGPEQSGAQLPEYVSEPEGPAVLLFTSGTSGAPKVAPLKHRHLLSYVLNSVEFGSATPDEALLLSVPPFHIAGVAAILTSCYSGRRVVPLAHFSAESWIATARTERVTHAFVVPTMLARITAEMESDPDARVPSLQNLSYGGARMPLPVLERALQLFPDTGFVNAYGLTETSSTISLLGPEDHRNAFESNDPSLRRRLESVGKPLEWIDVKIVDAGSKPVTAGEIGQILVSGAQVAGHPPPSPSSETAERDKTAGWLRTGDLGYMDPDGYLYVLGRADEVIIRGGENISPAEVENTLMRHPDVTGAVVVGLPDEEWGESVAAMVTLRRGAEVRGDDIAQWAASRLGHLKAPQRLVIRDELPVTGTGKVLRRQVREELGGWAS